MLANQVKIPDVQVPKEPVKAPEVKASRDNSSSRDFDRIMQNGRREQQDYNHRQQESRRQANAKEAPPPKEQNVRANDKPERDNNRKDHTVDFKDEKKQPVESKESKGEGEKEHKETSEKVLKKEESKEATLEPAKETTAKTPDQKLEQAEKSETSQWLDTILSMTKQTEQPTEAAKSDGTDDSAVTLDNKVSLLLVQQVLAENDSDADLSELEGEDEVSLSQLKSMLSEADYKAVLAQLSSGDKPAEVSSDQEFEALLAQLNQGNESKNGTDTSAKNNQPITDLINQAKQPENEAQAVAPQVKAESTDTAKVVASAASAASLLQGDKQGLAKEDKFKQSSLMNAMQLNTYGETDGEKVATNNGNKTLTESLAPTTKVLDLGATTQTVGTDKPQAAALSPFAAQLANSETKETQSTKLDVEMLDAKPKESSETKLASLLGQLGGEEVKTSDLANRAEKVNVGGVTMDKTLQMPKLENITQSKNEVVVRENILFNKQELASQMQTQVGLMMARNMKSVDIRLDPPELGSMQVKLAVQNDQATVSFVVSSQQAKDALENSLPKLKELLEQQGLQLADSDVNQQGSQTGGNEDEEQNGIAKNGLDAEAEGADDELEQQQQMINRAINSPWNVSYYA